MNNQNWYTGGIDYPEFRFDNSETNPNGFNSLNVMDKFLMVMEKIIVPIGNLIPKLSDSAARHREINASQHRSQDILSILQQQQNQMQQIMQQWQSMQWQQIPYPQTPMYFQPTMYLPQQLSSALYNQNPVVSQEIQWNNP